MLCRLLRTSTTTAARTSAQALSSRNSTIVSRATGYSAASVMDDYNAKWEGHWKEGVGKGQMWDKGASPKSLVKALQDPALLGSVDGLKCFVPGCGRGYDVITFAQHGAATSVGLDLVPEAMDAAREELQQQLADKCVTEAQAGRVQFVAGDFMAWTHAEGEFDVGFDYTFGCAMHPSARKDWAAHWKRHVRNGGRLVTLIFPVDPNMDVNVGPPFPVSPNLYKELLEPAGFRLDHLEQVEGALSQPERVGKEWLGIWTLQK